MPNLRPTMQRVLTVAVATVALYVMLQPVAPADAQKWAESAVTFVVGC